MSSGRLVWTRSVLTLAGTVGGETLRTVAQLADVYALKIQNAKDGAQIELDWAGGNPTLAANSGWTLAAGESIEFAGPNMPSAIIKVFGTVAKNVIVYTAK